MEIVYSIFIGMISSKIVGMIDGTSPPIIRLLSWLPASGLSST